MALRQQPSVGPYPSPIRLSSAYSDSACNPKGELLNHNTCRPGSKLPASPFVHGALVKKVTPYILAILLSLMVSIPTVARADAHSAAQKSAIKSAKRSERQERKAEKKAQRSNKRSAKRFKKQHQLG